MFRKIALATVLALGSVSGALAYNNVGEIEPNSFVQIPAGHDAFASARRATAPVMQSKTIVDRHGDVSNY